MLDELVLSDVHVYTDNSEIPPNSRTRDNEHLRASKFYFYHKSGRQREINDTLCGKELTTEALGCECTVDEDGDLLVNRKPQNQSFLYIEHTLQTPLSSVGSQVWYGALLLCDFILHHPHLLRDQVVCDLGAGVGITSIIAALYARHIYCTDYNMDVLQIAERNVSRNRHLFLGDQPPITIAELDWFSTVVESKTNRGLATRCSMLQDCDVIVAADVIYDDEITDAFFRTIYSVLQTRNVSVYIAMEKRYVFTTDDLDTVCPAYYHFTDCIQKLMNLANQEVTYKATQVPTDFPLYFTYDRSKHMELWKIISTHVTR